MSVRATERLLGEIVYVPYLSGSPKMTVIEIDEDSKLITTSWFDKNNAYQEGVFHAKALDRAD